MITMTCDRVRELLPERGHDSLPIGVERELDAHLTSCPECREEARFLATLLQARPQAPQGLEATIMARLQAETGLGAAPTTARVLPFRRRRWLGMPSWALSAAALVVVGLGTGVIWSRKGTELVQEPSNTSEDAPLPESWLWDDGMVAGAPVLDGLSEEDLETLLKELGG
jgi:predicted anti-sigma-YlaC factor YlaD